MKLNLIFPDYLVGLAIFFSLGAHYITIFLVTYYTDAGQGAVTAREMITAKEVNPVMGYIFALSGLSKIFSLVVVPAYISAVYISFRLMLGRSISKGKITSEVGATILMQTAMVIVFVFFIDFSHDLAILLGVLAQNGWL